MDSTRGSLLKRVGNHRDGSSWREFFAIYYPILLGYARVRGLKACDAEDVAQDCMMILQRRLPHLQYDRSKGKFKSWLWRVANHEIIRKVRKRTPAHATTGILVNMESRENTPDEVFDRIWQYEHARACLESLRPHFEFHIYEAFRLFALEEMPVEQVCEKLGMSKNQVYVAKHRVMHKLKEQMSRMLGGGHDH
ncbi:MAG: sigma-70 family RNA polymerase sigma factor [Phycisphaerae bacterium]|nr:sigma-70 family RNA polymerase sigma factor [Phycisphaerae bacterium]